MSSIPTTQGQAGTRFLVQTRRKPMSRDRKVGLLLLMPLVILILGLTVYPISQVFNLALHQQGLYSQEATFVGLQNFEAVLGHEGFTRSLQNTFVFTFGSLSLQMLIGLGIALFLNQTFPLRAPIRGVMLFSYLVPYVVAALTWLLHVLRRDRHLEQLDPHPRHRHPGVAFRSLD